MDGQRFDDLARLFSASLNRKRFFAIIAGIAAPAALSDDGAAKKRKKQNRGNGGGAVEPQGIDGAVCSGSCSKTADCPDSPGCICDPDTNRCNTVLCGGVCDDERPCQNLPECTCVQVAENLSLCETATCGNSCSKGVCGNVEGDSCVCDFDTNLCVTIACPGFCEDNADCTEQGQDNCACFFGNAVDVAAAINAEGAPLPPGSCGACLGAGASCDASAECCGQLLCLDGACVTDACPGACNSNPDCEQQGADECVCFLGAGVDVANAAEVEAEGTDGGSCGACLGAGVACDASTECCGQLLCRNGACQRKPRKPKKDRCNKHGHSCQRDNDCCAQAICYKGNCGEKDTHCKNDSECAQGYRCQGGPLAPGHRRCRKNGRRSRNRRNKNGEKR